MDIKLTIGLVVATVLLAAVFVFKNGLFPCCRGPPELRNADALMVQGYHAPQPLGPQPVGQPGPNMLVVQAEAVAVTPAVLASVAAPITTPVAAPVPGTVAAP
jgi:hypothetical protein